MLKQTEVLSLMRIRCSGSKAPISDIGKITKNSNFYNNKPSLPALLAWTEQQVATTLVGLFLGIFFTNQYPHQHVLLSIKFPNP